MGKWEAGRAPGKKSPRQVPHTFWFDFCWESGRKGACFVHVRHFSVNILMKWMKSPFWEKLINWHFLTEHILSENPYFKLEGWFWPLCFRLMFGYQIVNFYQRDQFPKSHFSILAVFKMGKKEFKMLRGKFPAWCTGNFNTQ